MAYPVQPLTRPKALTGQTNGRLNASILTSTPGRAGGLDVLLVDVASRAWRALAAAAADNGHTLKLSGGGCAYRPYATQERIFQERYTTTPLAGRPTKTWQGVTWWQRPGTAVAAVPGTSNHGWGLAVDVGEERDSDLATEPLDSDTLNWLLANEERFGWSHEVQSEPWHLRYFPGDQIPRAVLDFEHGTPDPSEEDDMKPRIISGDQHPDDWFITGDFVTCRHITKDFAGGLIYFGQAEWDSAGNKPFVFPQAEMDRIVKADDGLWNLTVAISNIGRDGAGGVTAAQVADEIDARQRRRLSA